MMKVCLYCGGCFVSKQGRKPKFCSEACRRAWWKKQGQRNRRSFLVVCALCGKEFESIRKNQKYCSLLCANKANNTKRTKNIFTCKYCGKEYHAKCKDRNTYCSRECAFADKAKRCKTCGKVITGSQSDYCSVECKERAINQEIECIVCGKIFRGRNGAKYCSDECRKEREKCKERERYHLYKAANVVNPIIKKRCAWCGEEFETNYYSSRRLYCSVSCAESAYKHTEKAKQRMEEYCKRRNEKITKQLVERFSYADIARRDGWRCHICGKKINPKLKWPHPKAPTFDHLIPIADCGQHVMGNVRLAHFICNARRSNIGHAQLVLDLRP